MNLQSRQESPKVPAIQLPWKNDTIKVGAQIINDVRLNEILNTVTDADVCKETSKTSGKICIGTKTKTEIDLKEALHSNAQQGANQELCKAANRHSKLQRN